MKKRVSASRTEQIQILMPEHINGAGRLFGGKLVEWIDVVASVAARRHSSLDFAALKKIGVVLKRAQYFILCKGKAAEGISITPDGVLRGLVSEQCQHMAFSGQYEQMNLWQEQITREDVAQCLTGQI